MSRTPRSHLPLVCSRRTLLAGIGAGTVLAAAGCTNGSGSDAPPATFTMCGANACIDLNNADNTALASAGGSMIITPGSATIIVIRTSATAVAAVSDICTHARCGVNYDASQSLLVCPCHGSEFQLNGSVAQGPARLPLRAYTATLDTATNTITVTL